MGNGLADFVGIELADCATVNVHHNTFDPPAGTRFYASKLVSLINSGGVVADNDLFLHVYHETQLQMHQSPVG